ncbi:MAG: hypothetical protein A3I12_03700 [Gammaproteobacteria bacterium RIFCSPLOWO2_02_FULL_38_11]|nr:MAG: hypothetical protein A3B69_02525 [Gammaproteobacteria bacterium RIFCSPHIGHO2_02_FULL_38_33]OGT23931.1 MAG: hypothetical protein A2W47_01745 [Gammaproteobacteria bacterium RIFCSPHIGHO2_12_38_15]OGT67753.1 MAG: hypothetical protein A3I12_03700 [Gammaproteobacteria bacterium RIFCSPLOWO2_02_FULL_38_11]
MCEVATAVDSLLEYYNQIKHGNVNQVAEKLYNLRITSREAPSSLPWLNNLLRDRLHKHDHHINPMYIDLLANRLDKQRLEAFISEYYWGSGYGFQREVINLVYKTTDDESFKEYLKLILIEEQKPRPHYMIFQEVITALGFQLKQRKPISLKFVQNQHEGYSSNVYHAFGYALGIEVEADYQISLLACALSNLYPDEISTHEYFEIHIDTSGEEMHAKETCLSIEKLIQSEQDIQTVIFGFDTAIRDTGTFLHEIRETLQ